MSVLFEESPLHPPLFRLQFAEPVFGQGFALAPFLFGMDGRLAPVAFLHPPAFVDEEALVLLESGARTLVLRLATLDCPPFEFASRWR